MQTPLMTILNNKLTHDEVDSSNLTKRMITVIDVVGVSTLKVKPCLLFVYFIVRVTTTGTSRSQPSNSIQLNCPPIDYY